jgi:hypothetical protein
MSESKDSSQKSADMSRVDTFVLAKYITNAEVSDPTSHRKILCVEFVSVFVSLLLSLILCVEFYRI